MCSRACLLAIFGCAQLYDGGNADMSMVAANAMAMSAIRIFSNVVVGMAPCLTLQSLSIWVGCVGWP